MKQSLQLRLGQQITMTPQLQQAIRLLQLSTLDLQQEIQQALESNIMLEVAETEDYREGNENGEASENFANEESNYSSEESNSFEYAEQGYEDFGGDNFEEHFAKDNQEVSFDDSNNIPNELVLDSQWEDIYGSSLSQYDYPNPQNDENIRELNQGTTGSTLREHLQWQLDLTPFSEVDRQIATAVIDAIEEDGYLRTSIADLAEMQVPPVELEEVEVVLHRIQRFDPVGIGARNLSECLLLQLNELPERKFFLNEAKQIVQHHLDLLAAKDYTALTRKLKISRDDLKEVVEIIQSLNPRPGAQIESESTNYIVPDVFVKKVKGQWKVELNPEIAPKLRVNAQYANLISKARNASDVSSLKNHLQEARWFIKSLKSRHETLLKVAKCIVKRQTGFLEYGDEAMKPLVLHDIATELEMHESTISRVTTQKYIHTSRGIFELKYFFSSHVNMDNGGECSSTAIRALIKKLIASENAAKPLSDSKIARLLSERGINVARRTVAKYREFMEIPPSNERKQL